MSVALFYMRILSNSGSTIVSCAIAALFIAHGLLSFFNLIGAYQ